MKYQEAPLSIGFNAQYLLEVLQQIKGKTFSLHFNDAMKPFLMRDSADDNVFYVLMPMRV